MWVRIKLLIASYFYDLNNIRLSSLPSPVSYQTSIVIIQSLKVLVLFYLMEDKRQQSQVKLQVELMNELRIVMLCKNKSNKKLVL